VTPLAARLGIAVDTRFNKGQGAALVAWQHEEISTIVAHLGEITPLPPPTWPGERLNLVWVFKRAGGGWAFSQVLHRVRAGARTGVSSES